VAPEFEIHRERGKGGGFRRAFCGLARGLASPGPRFVMK